MSSEINWEAVENILCVRLDSIGDLLMTTPAIRALRCSGPGRRITLLTSEAGAAAATLIPEIDDIIVYDAPWIKATAPRPNSERDYAMIEQLRAGRFDAAVIFTVYSQNPLPAAFLCFMADIPGRLAHCHENPYQLLNPWIPDPEPDRCQRHEVQRQLDLVAAVGSHTADERLSLTVPDGARERVLALLNHYNIDPAGPWAVLHPGATAPSRRYPAEQYAEVVRQLNQAYGWQFLITGTGAEQPLVETIRSAAPGGAHGLVDALTLGELAGLIAEVPLLIANNTGPVHMAAAVGTPVVDLYALTNPQHTPWMVPHRVLNFDVPCKYCYHSICAQGHHDCLRRVPPEAVVEAAVALYGETAGRRQRNGRR